MKSTLVSDFSTLKKASSKYEPKLQKEVTGYLLSELQNICVALTPNRPVIHTCFTYPKLNMDDFSILACSL